MPTHKLDLAFSKVCIAGIGAVTVEHSNGASLYCDSMMLFSSSKTMTKLVPVFIGLHDEITVPIAKVRRAGSNRHWIENIVSMVSNLLSLSNAQNAMPHSPENRDAGSSVLNWVTQGCQVKVANKQDDEIMMHCLLEEKTKNPALTSGSGRSR